MIARKKTKEATRNILMIIIITSILAVLGIGVYARASITVEIDGTEINFPDQQPFIRGGRTLVPVRFISEELGYNVSWNEVRRRVTIFGNGKVVYIDTKGSASFGSYDPYIATTNLGEEFTLDVPAQIVNDRTVVPLRFVSEVFGNEVGWDHRSRVVSIIRGEEPKGLEAYSEEEIDEILKESGESRTLEDLFDSEKNYLDFILKTGLIIQRDNLTGIRQPIGYNEYNSAVRTKEREIEREEERQALIDTIEWQEVQGFAFEGRLVSDTEAATYYTTLYNIDIRFIKELSRANWAQINITTMANHYLEDEQIEQLKQILESRMGQVEGLNEFIDDVQENNGFGGEFTMKEFYPNDLHVIFATGESGTINIGFRR